MAAPNDIKIALNGKGMYTGAQAHSSYWSSINKNKNKRRKKRNNAERDPQI